MARHEMTSAAAVMTHEIAATRNCITTIQGFVARLKDRTIARLKVGTEADAALRATRKDVMHDIDYPAVSAMRHS